MHAPHGDIVRKGSSVVSAVPTQDVMFETIDQQLFTYLMYRTMNDVEPGRLSVYHLPVKDVMEYLRIDRASKLRDSLERLSKGSIAIDYYDEVNGEVRTVFAHYLSADISSTGAGMLKFAFDPIISLFLRDPKVYAAIRISRYRDLTTFAAQRLYENMSLQYMKHTPVWETTVDELRQMFQTGSKHARFDNFRTHVLERAIAEVNAIADFEVSAEYVKGGQGGGVVAVRLTALRKSHRALVEAAATKRAGAAARKPRDTKTVDMLDGQSWDERGGPAQVTSAALDEALPLVESPAELDRLLAEWRDANRGRSLADPDRLFLSWLGARLEKDQDPLLKDIDSDVFGTLLGSKD